MNAILQTSTHATEIAITHKGVITAIALLASTVMLMYQMDAKVRHQFSGYSLVHLIRLVI
jgi:hypothetical protein